MVRRYLFIFLITIFYSRVLASPIIERFMNITSEQGLSHNSVNCIVKDKEGFIWIGTENGLNRFDGYYIDNFLYQSSDSNGIAHHSISDLFRDSNNQIWFTTKNDHLQKINTKDLSFETKFDGVFEDEIYHLQDITEDGQKRLWLIASEGILTYNLVTDKIKKLNIISGFDFKSITAIFRSEDQIWFSNNNGQIGIYHFNNQSFQSIDLKEHFHEAQKKISSLYFNESFIYIGTLSHGLYVFNHDFELVKHLKRGNQPHGLTSNLIKHIEEDEEGRIWVSSSIRGINILEQPDHTIKHILRDRTDYTISGEGVNCLYKDDLDNLWIGTYIKGLNLWLGNDQNFTHFNLLKDWKGQNVPSMVEDQKGDIWVANGGGLSRISSDYRQVIDYQALPNDPMQIKEKKVRNLAIDSKGNLILGTRHHGLIIKKTNDQIIPITSERILGTDEYLLSIAHITTDNQDNIIIASNQGLFILENQTYRVTRYGQDSNYDLNIGLENINFTYVDQQNNYWLATADRQIIYLNTKSKKYTSYRIAFPSAFEDVKELNNLLVTEKYLWIGTRGAGLARLDRQTAELKLFTTDEGLPDNDVKALQKDKNGVFWTSSNNGIFSFDPKSESINKFTISDGLQDKSFIINSSWQSSSGKLYFGGYKGFNLFHPDSIKIDHYIPPVRIAEVSVQDKNGESFSINMHNNEERIVLKHHQQNVSFGFSSFNYNRSSKINYAYKLEGLDEHWNYSSVDDNINFRNLPPGDFRFLVKAVISDSSLESKLATFPFSIKQSPWKTNWAFGIYGILIFGFLYLSRQITIDQINLKNSIKINEVEARKAREIDSLKSEFYTNISHDFKTPLSLIITPLQKMFDERDFILDNKKIESFRVILNNAERLQKLINQIIDLTKIQEEGIILNYHYEDIIKSCKDIIGNFQFKAESQNIDIELNSYLQSCWGFFDKDVLEKIIFNLLSNALKHTPPGGNIFIKINISYDDHHLPIWFNMIIADSGKGIESTLLNRIFDRYFSSNSPVNEKSDGIGLSLVKKLIEMHKGQIKIKSKPEHGTKVLFRLPLSSQFLLDSGIITEKIMEEGTKNDDYFEVLDTEKKKPLLLIAEDEPQLLSYLVENLKNSYQILAVNNGEMAFQKAIEKIPDLIISDFMMPKMNGDALLQKLRGDGITSHIPFIMLTAKAELKSQIDSYAKGVDDYVTKPFNFLLLRSRIVNLLKLRDQLKKKYQKGSDHQNSPSSDLSNQFMKSFYDILEENYQDPDFNIAQIEEKLNLSHTQLYRKLKALTNYSGNTLLRNFRLKKAENLLTNGLFNISQVAYQVGFNDPAYFSRCFTKFMGLSPKEYIERHLHS
ncbi:MAG: hybrid sensor histidine kinase/response regulator transcription factor [Candidatus Cyclobacteriaceae bacterium M3_2C_046]